jgi:hypothetical protein
MFVFPIVNEVRSRNLDRISSWLLPKHQVLSIDPKSIVLNRCESLTRVARLVLMATELSGGIHESSVCCADLYISTASSSELLDSTTAVGSSDT